MTARPSPASTSVPSTAAAAADELAQRLEVPAAPGDQDRWPGQSLTKGAAGIALLHIERAHTGAGSWQTAHRWVRAATDAVISAADNTGLHFGAPAVSFVLHAAGADGSQRYQAALNTIDPQIDALVRRRVTHALTRIRRADLPAFAEYDLLQGLTGIGAHLLRHRPGSDALEQILTYLVALTVPLPARSAVDGKIHPGWWVFHDPHRTTSKDFPGGHANLGIAHGITGPLALLAQALRRGITVDGHHAAIGTICTWLDIWRQDADSGPWWPQWITCGQQRPPPPGLRTPYRPSWCYGTPGIARAMQLAAIATGDPARQQLAERALLGCLSAEQLARITDTSLCHGWAGLHHTVWRTARDALTPEIGTRLPELTDVLVRHGLPGRAAGLGFLEGGAGLALALHTAAHGVPATSGWDACLLID